jgi:hypothetical protein
MSSASARCKRLVEWLLRRAQSLAKIVPSESVSRCQRPNPGDYFLAVVIERGQQQQSECGDGGRAAACCFGLVVVVIVRTAAEASSADKADRAWDEIDGHCHKTPGHDCAGDEKKTMTSFVVQRRRRGNNKDKRNDDDQPLTSGFSRDARAVNAVLVVCSSSSSTP